METLHLSPLLPTDFPRLVSHATTYPPGHDLVGPPTPLCCPVSTREEALARATFHFAHQRARFHLDPSVRYMKVELTRTRTPAPPPSPSPPSPSHDRAEDPNADEEQEKEKEADDSETEIIALARWHFYPRGYSFSRDFSWEAHALPSSSSSTSSPSSPLSIPPNFNVPLHNHILRARDSLRATWIPANRPCWILMHVVTHPGYRRRGAARMLVRWGMERAGEMGVGAYLEAGAEGRGVYEGMGWGMVGEEVRVGLEEGGGRGEFGLCRMAWYPGGGGGGGEEEEKEDKAGEDDGTGRG